MRGVATVTGALTGNTLFVDGGSHINGTPWTPEPPDVPDAIS